MGGGPGLVPVIVEFVSAGLNTTRVVTEEVAELLAGTTDEVKLTRTDGFVTVDSFVGIVIGMNIVVLTAVTEVIDELEISTVMSVLDEAGLPSGVLDKLVGEPKAVDGLEIIMAEGMSFEAITELLSVVLDITTVVPTGELATELAKVVVVSFNEDVELLVEKTVAAELEVDAAMTDIMLEDAADVTTAAVVRVTAAAEGTLTVMPDRLAHSCTNALPKSVNKSM
ncbi:hypothetical protein MMC11_005042 [Xylographa trunciseda]|nr:hypothetical protein [Xylographa trunciseda]